MKQLLGHRVLIDKEEGGTYTKSGIYVPNNESKIYGKGTVIAIGVDAQQQEEENPSKFRLIGKRVVYPTYGEEEHIDHKLLEIPEDVKNPVIVNYGLIYATLEEVEETEDTTEQEEDKTRLPADYRTTSKTSG